MRGKEPRRGGVSALNRIAVRHFPRLEEWNIERHVQRKQPTRQSHAARERNSLQRLFPTQRNQPNQDSQGKQCDRFSDPVVEGRFKYQVNIEAAGRRLDQHLADRIPADSERRST